MGLQKFLEERRKQNEAEKIYKREEHVAFQQGFQKGRVQGAYAEGLRRGKQQAKQPQRSNILGVMGKVSKGAVGVMQDIGNAKPMYPDIWGQPFGKGSGLFSYGSQSRSKHPKKKGKGKTITIHVK